MNVVALGTTEFLACCVRGLWESGCNIRALVSLPKVLLPDNSIDLKRLAIEVGSEYFETDNINATQTKVYIRSLSPDIIFSSWPKLIGPEVLSIPSSGVIGTHPTGLPFNKGRHPLQWQLVLGLRESALSFFWMDSGVDSGPIIQQIPYCIEDDDTILTLSNRLNAVAYSGSLSLGKMLTHGSVPSGSPHVPLVGNTWRKRDRYDVLIDFRMNADNIIKLIRSFTEPYPCATMLFENNVFHVLAGDRDEPNGAVPIEYIEPGQIIKIDDYFLFVKSMDAVLKLQLRESPEKLIGAKKYIHPPGKYLMEYPELSALFA
jgi:methionyl-tRNA formyltransferase